MSDSGKPMTKRNNPVAPVAWGPVSVASILGVIAPKMGTCRRAGKVTQVNGNTQKSIKLLLQAAIMATALGAPLAAQAIERGGTLVMAREVEPQTLDPYIPEDNGSIWAIEQICDSLIEPDENGGGLVPGLAKSWDISEDGLTYTFHLRDAKFNDGTPVTAADAAYSVNKATKGVFSWFLTMVEGATAPDDKTVVIKLKERYGGFLSVISVYGLAVVSEKAYTADPIAFGTNPVCAGAFKVERFERGTSLTLVPNEYSWEMGADGKPLPYIDKIEMRYVPDDNSRVLGLQSGDFDVITPLPRNQAATVKSNPELVLEVAPTYTISYVGINHSKKPLDNQKIRLALNYAANRQAILDTVYFGYGELPNSYMPKMNFWSADVPLIPYDIEKAKALVKEAGYDGSPIEIFVTSTSTEERRIATILQQGWQEAGLVVNIVEFEPGAFRPRLSALDYHTAMRGYISDVNDDDELAFYMGNPELPDKAAFSAHQRLEVAPWLSEARVSLDPAVRKDLYAKVQATLYNDGYSVPLNFSPALSARYAKVQDFKTLTTGWWWFKRAWLKQ